MDQIFRECVNVVYGNRHQYRIKFSGFDQSQKPIVFGFEYDIDKDLAYKQAIYISYKDEKDRWEINDDDDQILGWSEEKPEKFLVPTRWHLFDWKKYEKYIEGWEDDENLREGIIGNNHFSTQYWVKVTKLMRIFPIIE